MGENSKIEWCDHTVNLWWGCTEVHEGCDNCYARVLDNRYHHENPHWGNDKPRLLIESALKNLEKFQRDASKQGVIKSVFVGSMMDIFEKPMPVINNKGEKCFTDHGNTSPLDTGLLREELFMAIEAKEYENLMFLLLTKRPSNINKYIPESWKIIPPDNVMFGTSPVNQATADTLIPQLLKVKGRRFLSIEPQLDRIDIWRYLNRTVHLPNDEGRIDWIIQGGESGGHKRPFDIDWAYDLLVQCKSSHTPYFFKQIDKVQSIPEDLMIREFPKTHAL